MQRWIVHIDMDAFFASVEQLDFPEYRGKPLIIGSDSRGVVSTASYEARKFGIHSAMPVFQARKLCPHGIFVHGRMGRYIEKSREVMQILVRFSPLVEEASIDEAYLDLTGLETALGSVESIVQQIQRSVVEETGLTCSLGLAPVKFLAKITSDLRKPAGLSILYPHQVQAFLETLDVGKIPGVGKKTLHTLHGLGVHTAGDVQRLSKDFWERKLGKAGLQLFERAHGIDPRPVVVEYEAKSESAENTFEKDTDDVEELTKWLMQQAERVGARLRRQKLVGRTVTLKVKFADFNQITRSRTLDKPTNSTREIYETAVALLYACPLAKKVRLIGVGVSSFGQVTEQLSLFAAAEEVQEKKDAALDSTLDQLRAKFGTSVIVRGKLLSS